MQKKYRSILQEEDEPIKMIAKEIFDLQELVKANRERDMSYDDYMSLFKAEVLDFTVEFNSVQDIIYPK